MFLNIVLAGVAKLTLVFYIKSILALIGLISAGLFSAIHQLRCHIEIQQG